MKALVCSALHSLGAGVDPRRQICRDLTELVGSDWSVYVVRQGSDACVELFFVRKGRLVGQEAFFLDKVAGWSDGGVLSAFVRQL